MDMNNAVDIILDKIKKNGLIPNNKPYNVIQDNLSKCTMVVNHILSMTCDLMYKVDVSEYFNLVMIRIDTQDFGPEACVHYINTCKKFKETFTESGIEVNVAIMLGDIGKNEYVVSTLY